MYAYNIYATLPTTNPLFSGFSSSQNVSLLGRDITQIIKALHRNVGCFSICRAKHDSDGAAYDYEYANKKRVKGFRFIKKKNDKFVYV